MPTAESVALPRNAVDARGRALPMTEQEVRDWAEEVARGLAELDEMGDEEEQSRTVEALKKAVDEEPLSDRKRFG